MNIRHDTTSRTYRSKSAHRICILGIVIGAALTGGTTLRAQELFRHPVSGSITDSSATVVVWLRAAGAFKLRYGTDPALTSTQLVRETEPISAAAATDNTAKVELRGLTPSTRYYYRVTTTAGAPVSAIQSFVTFPKAGTDAPATILFGSCQQRRDTDSGRTFRVAESLGGDVFLQMGDWTYPDYRISGFPEAEGSIRASYAMRLDTLYPFATRILSKMGLVYTWDDHDYRANNSDGAIPAQLKAQLQEGYTRYMPHYPLPNNAGIWHSFMIGNAEIFMIDSRSQRDPIDAAFQGNSFNPPDDHSMLAGTPVTGVDQRSWLIQRIEASTARWKIIASPVFFNPAAAQVIPLALLINRADIAKEIADKWVGYPADLNALKTLLQSEHGRNVLVISGDAHVNIFDDGSHSIVPEFMVGNLDIPMANAFQQLKENGIEIWTETQKNTLSTVGRIRIETTPRHRLLVESFDELGERQIMFEMIDSSASSGVGNASASGSEKGTATVIDGGRALRLELGDIRGTGSATLTLFNTRGEMAFMRRLEIAGGGSVTVPLPTTLGSGIYNGSVMVGGRSVSFRISLVR